VLALIFVTPAAVALVWRWSLAGAAAAGLVYQLFAVVYLVPRFARVLPIGGATAWFGRLARVLGAAGLGYGPALWLMARYGATRLPVAALAWMGGSAVFAALAWGLLLHPDSRAEAIRRLRSMLRSGA
jgi:hypothetical protein